MDTRISYICERVGEAATIRQIAAELEISAGQVIKIINDSGEEGQKQYARARDIAADIFEADILTEAAATTSESAAASRIRIDALKWVAARRAPKKYGERVQQEISGPDGNPVQTQTNVRVEFVNGNDPVS